MQQGLRGYCMVRLFGLESNLDQVNPTIQSTLGREFQCPMSSESKYRDE